MQEIRLPKQARSQERVTRILDAAASIIAEDGLIGLTTNNIARTAGVTRSSIYQYYSDKTAIVAAVYSRYLQVNTEKVETALTPPPERLERVKDILSTLFEDYFQLLVEDPVVNSILLSHATHTVIKEIENADSARNVNTIFNRCEAFFDHQNREEARKRLTLLFWMCMASAELAVREPAKDAASYVENTKRIIALVWDTEIMPLSRIPNG